MTGADDDHEALWFSIDQMRLLGPTCVVLLAAFGGELIFACASDARSPSDVGSDGGPGFVDARPDGAMVPDECRVPPEAENGVGLECTKSAPPDAFNPALKWAWSPAKASTTTMNGIVVTPLVGNFTDDNGDGRIDLCDIPDVLVTDFHSAQIVMLAGNDGRPEVTFEGVDPYITPAFGDLDGDGIPEVVANDPEGHIVVFAHDGKVKWKGVDVGRYKEARASFCHAIAIYDLDADGTPEIIAGFEVFDAHGKSLFAHAVMPTGYVCPANTAADLDGDGRLEAILGNAAYHSDGSLYWKIDGPPGQPQVANLDADPEPEIFIAREDGILVLEHDGKVKFGPTRFVDEPASPTCWSKPAAVHDLDGDGVADLAASTCTRYGALKVGPTGLSTIWSASIDDASGVASSTAFDFLGRGAAQAVYGDQSSLWVFDGRTGNVAFKRPRASSTLIEYPVVADVDNDQSADIVVVSSDNGAAGSNKLPTVQVFEDAEKRWIPTRRIWNQHAYHVTNVREDGTIPRVMKKSWQRLNTFRTNAQIGGSGDCAPPPSNPPK